MKYCKKQGSTHNVELIFLRQKCRILTFRDNLRQNGLVLHNCNKNACQSQKQREREMERAGEREILPESQRETQRFSLALSGCLQLSDCISLSLRLTLCFLLSVKHAFLLQLCKTTCHFVAICRKTLKYIFSRKNGFLAVNRSKSHALRSEPTPDFILLCVAIQV